MECFQYQAIQIEYEDIIEFDIKAEELKLISVDIVVKNHIFIFDKRNGSALCILYAYPKLSIPSIVKNKDLTLFLSDSH